MPLTRSASRAAAVHDGMSTSKAIKSTKRTAEESGSNSSKKLRFQKTSTEDKNTSVAISSGQQFLPAALKFSFEEGKKHLITVDGRFENLFKRIPCKPFEQLETVHPFRALTTSILGQQISWMAARSINHRFRRLFDPSLPEQPTDDARSPLSFFPGPEQVACASIEALRTAGLSARKAEYVKDLASRFVDGRLSVLKLADASDEDLARMLLEVRGIGKWTVDMFSIFSMRRPDILPVGDLGVQRGLLRWCLLQHSSDHSLGILPEKNDVSSNHTGEDAENSNVEPILVSRNANPEAPSGIPPPLTPSTKCSLKQTDQPQLLPSGLSVSILKSRLKGKKVKGAFLTPQEMEELTKDWKPYRSLVYYMWTLSEGNDD
ncbi:DNA glycosylase [Amanita rubescens]|nr:DNA glycosylase [Amanita rubescens]